MTDRLRRRAVRLRFLLILATGLLIAASNPRSDAARKDRERLQGTWELLTLEVNVQQALQITLDDLPAARFLVKGKGCRLQIGETDLEMTYQLDPRKAPRAIDLIVTTGPDKGKTFRAIYALDGATLKICHHERPGMDRPSDFASSSDSGFMVFTWRRAKP
jgi:uncharacterized protein (TIGR03067 family)